jgi:hypothetical protein
VVGGHFEMLLLYAFVETGRFSNGNAWEGFYMYQVLAFYYRKWCVVNFEMLLLYVFVETGRFSW